MVWVRFCRSARNSESLHCGVQSIGTDTDARTPAYEPPFITLPPRVWPETLIFKKFRDSHARECEKIPKVQRHLAIGQNWQFRTNHISEYSYMVVML